MLDSQRGDPYGIRLGYKGYAAKQLVKDFNCYSVRRIVAQRAKSFSVAQRM
jgi:tRNA G10  N-methylase Trm11